MEETMGTGKRVILELTHPNAAGIDIGGSSHFVAVPSDRDDDPVREFKAFTADLRAMADWLRSCDVDVVAMESTGVYWIPVYELLESQGFTVYLVNARAAINSTQISGQPHPAYPKGVDPDQSPVDSGALGCDGGVWPEDYPGDSGWGA